MKPLKKYPLTLPMLMAIAGTRALLGIGIGLLASERMAKTKRRIIGRSLFTAGALATLPILFQVFGKHSD